MSENISDILSVLILLSVPITLLFVFAVRIFRKLRSQKKEEIGKYYPEW